MIVGFLVGWFGGCRFSGWLDGSPAASSPPAAFSWLDFDLTSESILP